MKSPIRLTRVGDLPESENKDTVTLESIIRKHDLTEMFQFNFAISVEYVMQHIHTDVRDALRSHFFYGFYPGKDSTEVLKAQQQQCRNPANIKLHKIRLPYEYGSHHSKMMILSFKGGKEVQVVIHTCNLIPMDWENLTQGVWISPRLGKKSKEGRETTFQTDLIDYLNAYNNDTATSLAKSLRGYDFTPVKATLIASVPGNYFPRQGLYKWGIGRLKNELQDQPTDGYTVAQCSSIATLGPNDKYLTPVIGAAMGCDSHSPLKLVYPTVANIQDSLDGYMSGASIHFKRASDQQQRQLGYMTPNLHSWSGVKAGRHRAAPHIKTYMRVKPSGDLAWVLLTSANLSKQAWGQFPANGQRQWVQSWEIGVLVTPQHYGENTRLVPSYKSDKLPTNDSDDDSAVPIRMPFDLPLTRYVATDSTWSAAEKYEVKDWLGHTWG